MIFQRIWAELLRNPIFLWFFFGGVGGSGPLSPLRLCICVCGHDKHINGGGGVNVDMIVFIYVCPCMTKPTYNPCAHGSHKSAWLSTQLSQHFHCALSDQGFQVSSCDLCRLWSGWADAQADLSLHSAHWLFWWFCHDGLKSLGLGQNFFY